jgi:hypothetical protein
MRPDPKLKLIDVVLHAKGGTARLLRINAAGKVVSGEDATRPVQP